jgi:tetratricopeptide (TPR) repeat protein
MRTATWLIAVCLVSWPEAGRGQDFADLRRQFEAGRYREVADAAGGGDRPQLLYLAGQAYQRLEQPDQARGAYSKLAAGPEGSAWALVGRAAVAVMNGNYDEGIDAARQASSVDGGLAEAHYQLGLAEAFKQNFGDAATAFDRAAEIDPQFGYAHYQGGLAHYRAKRPDRMAQHFEMFLKLAPQAPERPEVESIMRTLRGKE